MNRPRLVDPEHIHVMLWAALFLADRTRGPVAWIEPATNDRPARLARFEPHQADRIGQMLVDTNVLALNEHTGANELYVYSYRHPRQSGWQITEVLKAIDGYENQARCWSHYPGSSAHQFCTALRQRAITRLPGYRDAAELITEHSTPLESAAPR